MRAPPIAPAAAHAPNCHCPRCRHLRGRAGAIGGTAALAIVAGGWGFVFIVAPALIALGQRLLTL